MKIIYSPGFTSTSYLDLEKRKGSLLGTKVCGSMELLSELELRAGIAVLDISESERLASFCEVMKIVGKDSVFWNSFQIDEMGVAKQLMVWVDSLMMAGWTPDMEVDSDKLKVLAELQRNARIKNVAARWNDLAELVSSRRILDDTDMIEVCMVPECLPLVIRRVLERLANQTHVVYQPVSSAAEEETDLGKLQRMLSGIFQDVHLCGDGSLEIHRFKNRKQAYEWYLSQLKHGLDMTGMLVANEDNCMLNDMAITLGIPLVHSVSKQSNPQLLQLFKLGMSLFVRPLNLSHLLSYLQIPGNPLGGVASLLAEVLVSEGGINEMWYQTIQEYDFTNAEGKDKRKERLKFIGMIGKEYDDIPVSDLRDYLNHLLRWTQARLRLTDESEERKEQLVILASFCRSLNQLLLGREMMDARTLLMLVDGIYQAQSFTHCKAKKGSMDMVTSIEQIADPVDTLYWLDAIRKDFSPYPYDFLNAQERDFLNAQGAEIPVKSVFYARLFEQQQWALMKVRKKLVLMEWEYDGNQPKDGHPLVVGWKSNLKGWEKCMYTDEKPLWETEKAPVRLLEIEKGYQLDAGQLEKRRRTCESQTSIDKLIQFPFDYVSGYLAGFWEVKDGELADLKTTEGLVAHRYIEKLFEEGREEMVAYYEKLSDEERKQRITSAICEKGAILLLSEYKMELHRFYTCLDSSVSELMKIIARLNLVPTGCEVELDVDLEGIGTFGGSVDMMLKNERGEWVIFDFKWSESQSYMERLKKNKAFQLELYKQAVLKQYGEEAKVVGTAYYLFPLKKLYTRDFEATENIERVELDDEGLRRNLYEELCQSYQYRRNELDHGWVDVNELSPLEDIEYHCSEQTLYPLDIVKGTNTNGSEGKKACPYVKVEKPPFSLRSGGWDNKRKDLRETLTTHSILKGRLS
jgi:hypothetical protein